MKIAVCDDESYWRESLTAALNEYDNEKHFDIIITYFTGGKELLDSGKKFDVIFLDYQMGKLNGIETAKGIRKNDPDCIIVFVSAYSAAAVEAYEVNAFRFLTKPLDKEKLFKALDDYRKREAHDDFIIFKNQDSTAKIRESEIIYCESEGKHTLIHTVKETVEIPRSIKEIENKLSEEKFFRCHKAYIASFFHIRSFTNTEIHFDSGDTAYISRSNLPAFKTAFREYVLKYNMERS